MKRKVLTLLWIIVCEVCVLIIQYDHSGMTSIASECKSAFDPVLYWFGANVYQGKVHTIAFHGLVLASSQYPDLINALHSLSAPFPQVHHFKSK